ncbi:MAG: Cas10/Cmr2 second palm domain-containing protein, partial [Phormidium sp.]
MNDYVVTVLDTTGIQPYIFGSNRLRENIGGSYLVDQATNKWAKDALRELAKRLGEPIQIYDPSRPADKPHVEDGELAAELVYAGGGNTVLLFQSLDIAKQFTRILSKRILTDAPGINLVAAHQTFDWDNESLHEVIGELMKNQLDRQKRERIPSSPLLGLGVTAACQSTQLVAVDMSDKHGCPMPYLVSREIAAKLDAVKAANDKLDDTLFDAKIPKQYKIPLDFDDFGRSFGENSYLAIIHADGNNMGDRFQKYGKDRENRDYITAMRKLSDSVRLAGLTALKTVANAVVDSIDSDNKVKGKFPIKDKYLPFRPLIYGGDDVTFVCDGRLGLELAEIYLSSFKGQKAADDEKLSACAGICVVKAHYPFARAYELSEQLCKSAKKFARDQKGENLSALDWHLAASGLFGSVGGIREREYQVQQGDLTMRPVLLEKHSKTWRTWPNFTSIIKAFNENPEWKARRNKIIALREKLREGIQATQQFIQVYDLAELPEVFKGNSKVQRVQKCG